MVETLNPWKITVAKNSYDPYTLIFVGGEGATEMGPFDRVGLRQLVELASRQLHTADIEETLARAQHRPSEE